jgi:hypothetical protein
MVAQDKELAEAAPGDSPALSSHKKKHRSSDMLGDSSSGPSGFRAPLRMDEDQGQRQTLARVSANFPRMTISETRSLPPATSGKAFVEEPSEATSGHAAVTAEGSLDDDFDTEDDFEHDANSSEDESDLDDTDDFFIPGPDQSETPDEDEGSTVGGSLPLGHHYDHTVHLVPEVNDECVLRFEHRLTILLDGLREAGRGVLSQKLTRSEECMTYGFALVLTRTSTDFLLNLFIPGISLENQAFLGKIAWTHDDFLSLPISWMEEDSIGIYGNTAAYTTAPNASTAEEYVGSAQRTLKLRIKEHEKVSMYTLAELPGRHRRSVHYRYICQDGVSSNFHVWATFDRSRIAPGYVLLLEAVFMVILGSYQDPGGESYHDWCNKASYDLVRELRAASTWPTITWKGLNAAWPCYQGFPKGTNKIEPCCNPACSFKTYPQALKPANLRKRVLSNSEDLLEVFCAATALIIASAMACYQTRRLS